MLSGRKQEREIWTHRSNEQLKRLNTKEKVNFLNLEQPKWTCAGLEKRKRGRELRNAKNQTKKNH